MSKIVSFMSLIWVVSLSFSFAKPTFSAEIEAVCNSNKTDHLTRNAQRFHTTECADIMRKREEARELKEAKLREERRKEEVLQREERLQEDQQRHDHLMEQKRLDHEQYVEQKKAETDKIYAFKEENCNIIGGIFSKVDGKCDRISQNHQVMRSMEVCVKAGGIFHSDADGSFSCQLRAE